MDIYLEKYKSGDKLKYNQCIKYVPHCNKNSIYLDIENEIAGAKK